MVTVVHSTDETQVTSHGVRAFFPSYRPLGLHPFSSYLIAYGQVIEKDLYQII